MITRRRFIASVLTSTLVAPTLRLANSQELTGPRRPNPTTFESGDLIWPKKQGAYVPYASPTQEGTVENDEARWKLEKVNFIRLARAGKLGTTADEIAYWKRVADEMEFLEFNTFYHRYSAGASPNDFIAYGGGGILYVGHVAIVDADAATNQLFVIEAISGKGLGNFADCVERVLYDDWLQARGDILVWHARLKGYDPSARAAIANYSRTQVGKPYDFWNFDLSSTTGFYCSKLVWQSIQQTTGVVLDDNTDPKRFFWFSPLQTMKSPQLVVLSSPGNYRNV
jgi:Permuted papain-like amidase enzyme, YaeF/YiiX, C92 family